MILYRADAKYRDITRKVLDMFRLQAVDTRPKSVDKQVMQAVGYAAQLRVKVACQPVFDGLDKLDRLFGALNYESNRPRLTVVRTNMGLLLRNGDE